MQKCRRNRKKLDHTLIWNFGCQKGPKTQNCQFWPKKGFWGSKLTLMHLMGSNKLVHDHQSDFWADDFQNCPFHTELPSTVRGFHPALASLISRVVRPVGAWSCYIYIFSPYFLQSSYISRVLVFYSRKEKHLGTVLNWLSILLKYSFGTKH